MVATVAMISKERSTARHSEKRGKAMMSLTGKRPWHGLSQEAFRGANQRKSPKISLAYSTAVAQRQRVLLSKSNIQKSQVRTAESALTSAALICTGRVCL
jgi:hypothetical protein